MLRFRCGTVVRARPDAPEPSTATVLVGALRPRTAPLRIGIAQRRTQLYRDTGGRTHGHGSACSPNPHNPPQSCGVPLSPLDITVQCSSRVRAPRGPRLILSPTRVPPAYWRSPGGASPSRTRPQTPRGRARRGRRYGHRKANESSSTRHHHSTAPAERPRQSRLPGPSPRSPAGGARGGNWGGGARGGVGWAAAGRAACAGECCRTTLSLPVFASRETLNSRLSPSASERKPWALMSVWCTNRSCSWFSTSMKPKPFCTSNHLHLPEGAGSGSATRVAVFCRPCDARGLLWARGDGLACAASLSPAALTDSRVSLLHRHRRAASARDHGARSRAGGLQDQARNLAGGREQQSDRGTRR